MSWWSMLFNSDKVVDNVLDKDDGLAAKAGAWIGNWNFTDEEKSEANREIMKLTTERLRAMEPFKVMQRVMVTIIMAVWGIIALSAIVCIFLSWDTRFENLMTFAMSEFAWLPIGGAVTTYLLGGVWPSRKN